MKLLIVLVAFVVTSAAQARMEVKQINLESDRVAVSGVRGVGVGDVLLYTHKGQQCDLPVVERNGAYAIVSTSKCRFKRDIRAGQSVEKSLLTATQEGAVSSHAGRGSASSNFPLGSLNPELKRRLEGLSVYAYLSAAADAGATGENEAGDSSNREMPGDRAFGFGAEYSVANVPAYGFSTNLGASYELERDYDKIRSGRNTEMIPNGGIKLSTWVLHANLGLEFNDRIRGLGGVNYSIPLESGPTELEGQLGYQVGASYSFTQQFAIDGLYRFLNYLDEDDFKVSLDGFLVRGRLVF